MSGADRARERIRWQCRRGLLELDLILHAFIDKYLDRLAQPELDALAALLEHPDPVLLDFVMGRCEPDTAYERDLVALMRSIAVHANAAHSLAPEGEIRGANG